MKPTRRDSALSWLALGVVLLPLACTVTAVDSGVDTRPNNSCSSSSDCDNGHCSDGLCQTLHGQIEALLVSITPAVDSSLPHLSFVTDVEDVPTSGGRKDLNPPGASLINGRLFLPDTRACYPTFTNPDPEHKFFPAGDMVSLPADITLSLRQGLLGLPQQTYYAKTGTQVVDGSYTFHAQVPAGDYDVYLVPPRGQEVCPVPPQLIRHNLLKSGPVEAAFLVQTISKLNLVAHWPKGGATLDGWLADIIEPLGGRAISTEVVLGSPTDLGDKSNTLDYGVSLDYSLVYDASTKTVEVADNLFRLRPPEGTIAPTIFLDRAGLDLFKGAQVELKDFTHYPTPVRVDAHVSRLDTGEPVTGQVTLVSTQILGVDPGVFASYQTTKEIGKDGLLTVNLPPGSYEVQVVPPVAPGIPPVAGALSALRTQWDVPLEPAYQAGKVLELPTLAELTGQARVKGAQVQVVPSPQVVLPFDQAFGAGLFIPRATAALVDGGGRFVVQADPGTFDVSVQAPEELGFGWFVRPGVKVQAEQGQDLGRVGLSAPSVFSGKALLDGKADSELSFASVRAYAYLDKSLAYTRDPNQAVSVIAVAETRADKHGFFRLLLPERIGTTN